MFKTLQSRYRYCLVIPTMHRGLLSLSISGNKVTEITFPMYLGATLYYVGPATCEYRKPQTTTWLVVGWYYAQCSEWVCKPKFFGDGFFDFNVTFWMCIMRIYSLKLPICHENVVKMVLNPEHLEHFSKNCLTLWVFTTVTCNFLVQ